MRVHAKYIHKHVDECAPETLQNSYHERDGVTVTCFPPDYEFETVLVVTRRRTFVFSMHTR